MPATTIVIAARDAARTIGRAVRSAIAQDACRILLVDDHSSDDTVALARATAGVRLDVIQPPEHRTLGFARHTGILAIRTPYAVWLDADDECLPGRVARLVGALTDRGAQVAADGAEFVDGATGRTTIAGMPGLLRGGAAAARLFERNYLPGPGVVALETRMAATVGFDASLHGAEDVDFLLRAIVAGHRFALVDEVGYRCHTDAGSHSRDLARQRTMYRRALQKHDYATVRRLYADAGEDAHTTMWGLASMAIFRDDYAGALQLLTESGEDATASQNDEAWRLAFQRGTLHLLLGRPRQASALLEEAEQIRQTPEGANNLGVATAQRGDRRLASVLFAQALTRYPAFLDARLNVSAADGWRITTHPLRHLPNRQDYGDRVTALPAPQVSHECR